MTVQCFIVLAYLVSELEGVKLFRPSLPRNRTMGVQKFQLFGYTSHIIGYNWAKFHCSSFFGF